MRFQQKIAGSLFGFIALAGPIQPLSFAGDNVEVWLEAEDATTIGANWKVVDSSSASGGQYLEPPAGYFFDSPPTDSASRISFNFQADGGTYLIHGLVNAPTGDNDSFWVRANGGNWVKWNLIEHSGSFIWDEVHHQPGSGSPVSTSFNLVSGSNTLEIVNREEGTLLDKVYITNTGNDPEFATPTEPPVETPTEPEPQPDDSTSPSGDGVGISLEAEDATDWGNWSVVADPSASSGEYLLPPLSGNYFDDPPKNSDSMITFTFQAEGGTYLMHALVKAPTGDNDSFWVRANAGNWVKWNLIEPSSSFIWDEVHHQPGSGSPVPVSFDLVSGTNTVQFALREEGTALDKIFITNTGDVPDAETPVEVPVDDAWYQQGDLISLHFPQGLNPITPQSMVVARMLLDHFELPYMAVTGIETAIGSFWLGSDEISDLTWGAPEGSADTWISARWEYTGGRGLRDKAIQLTAEAWRAEILSGGHVWALNHGSEDFPKEVLNYLNGVLGVSTAGRVDVLSVFSTDEIDPQAAAQANFHDNIRSPYYDIWDLGSDAYSESVLLNFTKDPRYGAAWERALRRGTAFACNDNDYSGCVPKAVTISPLLQLIGVNTDEINSWTDFAEYFAND